MPGCAILGTGLALPERIVGNAELERRVGAPSDWVVARTGIVTRRTVEGSGQATSDLAAEAARAALARAGLAAEDADLIMVATSSGDHLLPATACLVQAALGARRAAAFDLNAACAGFVYGLALADAAIAAGTAETVVLVGADALTRHVDQTDRNTAILFGDGAGAVVLGRGQGLLGVSLGADGRAAGDLCIPAGGSRQPVDADALATGAHKLRMNGPEVFRAAVHAMANGLTRALASAGLEARDLRWVIGHQANARILRGVAERIGLPLEAFWMNLQHHGNTGAASIPIALAEAVDAAALRPGDMVGLTAAGAGLAWGAAIIRWPGTA